MFVPTALAFVALVFIGMSLFHSPLSASETSAEASSTARVAYVEFPPISYRNEQGEPAGEFVDITRKVAAEAGYQLEFIYLPSHVPTSI